MDELVGNGAGLHRSGDAVSRCEMLTNHCLVLLCVANDPVLRVRDIAGVVGITERATQTILADLDRGGYVERIRVGRRNRYRVRDIPMLSHPLVGSATIVDLLEALSSTTEPASATNSPP